MAICNNCGKYVKDTDSRCLYCNNTLTPIKLENDSMPFLFGIVGFILSVPGIFWGILWKSDRPKRAKALIIGGIIGSILIFVIRIAEPLFILDLLNRVG